MSPASNPPAIIGRQHRQCDRDRPAFDCDHAASDRDRRPEPRRHGRRPDRAHSRATSPAPASAGTAACATPVTSGPTPGIGGVHASTTLHALSTIERAAVAAAVVRSVCSLSILLGLGSPGRDARAAAARIFPVAFDKSRAIFASYAIDGSGSPLQLQLKALRQVCGAKWSGAASLAITKLLMSRVYDRLESATLPLRAPARSRNDWKAPGANASPTSKPTTCRTNCACNSSSCRPQMQRERPLRGEDAVRATIRKMSNEEAERHRRAHRAHVLPHDAPAGAGIADAGAQRRGGGAAVRRGRLTNQSSLNSMVSQRLDSSWRACALMASTSARPSQSTI